ncbi:hypothetical protein predicted by Glimmer/Critica [Streptococcus dysgalactiae subsp. equisimilis AC-2713]|uniref:Uncharacterized protein n=1 Tax=Streptococcus dysgalactiae subsp. equisimilis AC-2713 TaxID=759913 RepID=A0AB33R4N6_STREQ|nr:hypothetical protein predicted by Glimmer/Critica [Streptococcus dysgalactiae subsp. equisimilis AC-2713]
MTLKVLLKETKKTKSLEGNFQAFSFASLFLRKQDSYRYHLF